MHLKKDIKCHLELPFTAWFNQFFNNKFQQYLNGNITKNDKRYDIYKRR